MSLEESREMLRGVVADVLGAAPDPDDPHVRPPAWTTAVGLDWPLVGVDERHGGAGGTLADVVALTEAAATQACSLPLFETQTARVAAAAAGAGWAPDAVVVPLVGPEGLAAGTPGGQPRLSGEVAGVAWASIADHLVVAVDGQLVWLPADADGVVITPGQNVADEPYDTVRFDAAVAEPLGTGLDGSWLTNRAALGRSAAMVGAAGAAATLTAEHVAAREQFGRPLSRFQLVRAGIAAMAGELELARGSLGAAVSAHVDGREVEPRTAAALIAAARAATLVLRTSHQLHGAIGVTREHRLHRFTRRLWAWRDQAGSQRSWERRLGELSVAGGPQTVWEWFTTTGDGAA